MNEEQALSSIEALRKQEISELKIKKEDFLSFRNILVKQEDFKHFRGIAQRGGDILYHYSETPRS
jgi:hypothetical protein